MSKTGDDLPNDLGTKELSRQQLTSLVLYLATRWPELTIGLDEDGEIDEVFEAKQTRRVGRPAKPSTVFRKHARTLGKRERAARFIAEDASRSERGIKSLEDRADDAGMGWDAYRQALNRARKAVRG